MDVIGHHYAGIQIERVRSGGQYLGHNEIPRRRPKDNV
jgi:hypothetical protein